MREVQILNALKENDYLKIDQLAKMIGVSSRTIRNDLQELAEIEQGFTIEKSAKLGYRLSISDKEKLTSYLAGFSETTIEMQKDRIESLLSLLLINENYQTVKQLSDELLVSGSQIKKDLSKLELYLKGSSLVLERKAHYGIRVISELKNRLLLLLDCFQRGNGKLLEKLETAFNFEKQKQLKDSLYHLISHHKWEIDYVEFRRLEEELFLLLLIKGTDTQTEEPKSFLTEVLQSTTIPVPRQKEIHEYFEASLLAKTKKLEILSNKQLLKEEITDFFHQMDEEQKTHFSADQEFIDLVYLHVAALIERSRKNVNFSNPYLEDISKDYPVIFNFAVIFSKWLEEKFQLKIASDEIGYLATHMTVPYHKWQQNLIENMLGESNAFSQFILNNAELFNLPVTLSTGLIGLYACAAISYNLGNHYKLYIPGAVTLSLFGFLFMTATFDKNGMLDITNFGAKGLFTSMFVALITVELYNFCKKHNMTIRMPDGVPDFVSKSFELIPVTLIVGGTFIIGRFALMQTAGELPPTILTRFLSPLVGSMDNPWSVLALNFCICLIFFFGIHSSVFSPITRPIMVAFIAENISAFQAGQPIPHFYTAGASSAFFGFTGCGISIGCIVACLF